jgi:4-hydroxybenzoate polyprenyltransferase
VLTDPACFIAFCCATGAPLLWLHWRAPGTLRILAGDLRPERLLHYDIMVLLGATLHWRAALAPPNLAEVLDITALFVALLYAAMFAIVSNNIEDLAIDRISNRARPLPQELIAPAPYRRIGWAALIIALLLAALIGMTALLAVAAISLMYHLYSCRPLRLKRIPILAKLIIGANSLLLALAGFVLAGGAWQAFPLAWGAYLFIAVGLAANFIDLKDTEGDRAEGIQTLPVLLGQGNARRLIVAFTVCAYASAAWLLDSWLLLPLNVALLVWHLRELLRTPFVEARVFRVYLLSQVALVAALWLTSRFAIF